MFKKISGIILLALTFAFSQTIYADDSFCRQGFSKIVNSLNLSADQKTKIDPILEQLKTAMRDNSAQMADIELQMKMQASSANMDQTTLNNLVDKKTTLLGNLMKARYSAQNQILAILTVEQKNKLQSVIQAEEEKMANKFKNCHSDD